MLYILNQIKLNQQMQLKINNLPTCIVYAPVDCYSGYSAHSRDIVKSLIEIKGKEWDIKVMACRWGNTPQSFIKDNFNEWGFMQEYIIPVGPLNKKPEYMIWITVPNEFQAIGNYNIGITAGIETTVCDPSWIEGCNRMDLTLVSSEHAKNTFINSKFEKKDQQGRTVGFIELTKPVEVMFEGLDVNVYNKNNIDVNSDVYKQLESIPEKFNFLFVGHYLQGDVGEDRKNVGMLIKVFLETFKNKLSPPSLILKTSVGGSSIMDRDATLKKIDAIRSTVKGTLPNIYLIHGDLSDKEMNTLYNHPRVKAMVNLTKGEGFGRPLLEFSATGKPVITSNWSGHTDFLKPEFSSLIGGTLTKVHPSAAVQNVILPESEWFTIDYPAVAMTMKDVIKDYELYRKKAIDQANHTVSNFSLQTMNSVFKKYLNNTPTYPVFKPINLPTLKKIQLPELTKPS